MKNRIKDPNKTKKPAFYKRKNFKYGSMASLITVLVVAAIICVNAILTVVVNKYPLSIDMTSKKNFQVSADTVKYLKKLNTNITFYVINTENGYQNAQTSDGATAGYQNSYQVLKQFPRYNSHISLQFVDVVKNPTFKTKYPNESLAANDIIVATKSKYKHLTSTDLFDTSTNSYGYSTVTGDKTEQAIDSAILYLTNQNLPSVVITQGHDESGYDGLKSLMTSNNYNVSLQDISQNKITANTNILAIVDPRVDFSPDEIKGIDAFLNNGDKYGKQLMVFFDPGQSKLPNLENYLANYWGISVGKGIVYDQTHAVSQVDIPVAQTLDTTVFTHMSSGIYTLIPDTRPLTLLFDSRNEVTTKSLIQTYNTAALWVPKSASDTSFTPSASDKKAQYTSMALGTKTVTSGSSNVLVSGSTAFIDSSILQQTRFNNANATISAANYIGGYKPELNILSKSLEGSVLTISPQQSGIIRLIFMFLIPLILIIVGIAIWLRRRHL